MKFDVSIFCMLIYELQVRVHSWLWRNRHRVTSHLKQLRKARHIMNHEFLIQNLVKCYVLNRPCVTKLEFARPERTAVVISTPG